MKYLIIPLALAISVNAESKYDQIHKRNNIIIIPKSEAHTFLAQIEGHNFF